MYRGGGGMNCSLTTVRPSVVKYIRMNLVYMYRGTVCGPSTSRPSVINVKCVPLFVNVFSESFWWANN